MPQNKAKVGTVRRRIYSHASSFTERLPSQARLMGKIRHPKPLADITLFLLDVVRIGQDALFLKSPAGLLKSPRLYTINSVSL